MRNLVINTPCIGRCSTVYGDRVCRGCNRYHDEIVEWNSYNKSQQEAIWARLERVVNEVMAAKVVIVDADLLKQQLEARKIRFMPCHSHYCWAYRLIGVGAKSIKHIEAYGISLLPPYEGLPLLDVRDAIDEEIYERSEMLLAQCLH
ncbi:DUF1289 domain-containing protein [Pseudomonas sp. RIT-To-2]|uniref:DUF1289 domain-containing protein n=1 Tax=Pseudomonas sp. RIT-To-2 TaxID=3462541 RepID=UPI0024134B86